MLVSRAACNLQAVFLFLNLNVSLHLLNKTRHLNFKQQLKSIIVTYTYILFISLIILSCKPTLTTNNNANCVENTQFKNMFFSKINYIENNISEVQDVKFKNILYDLSRYVDVSLESMMNYSNTYPFGVFESDKKAWLDWYEKNKCSNLKIKE